jgi:ABC-type antimicrobial peptide transport system permease subunit
VRAIIREIEPSTPIATVQTMGEAVVASVASRRFTTSLIAGFAAIAVLLAGLGVYGVITYSVNQRQFEMGIRIALGATPSHVVNQILGEGLRTGAIGAAIGLVAAWGATRLLTATLVDVRPGDPLTLSVVTLVLLTVALLAAWSRRAAPARRSGENDPRRVKEGTGVGLTPVLVADGTVSGRGDRYAGSRQPCFTRNAA